MKRKIKREKRRFGFIQQLSCILALMVTVMSVPIQVFAEGTEKLSSQDFTVTDITYGQGSDSVLLEPSVWEATYASVTDAIYGGPLSYLVTLKKDQNPEKFTQKKLIKNKKSK